MHEQQPDHCDPPHQPDAHESERDRPPEDRPQIYVADLTAYNAGRLHGIWLDANQNPDQLADAVAAMLTRSPAHQ